MNMIRLKANLDIHTINDRLRYGPDIVELYLGDKDMERPGVIRDRIRLLHEKGVKPYLHHPPRYGRSYLDILSEDPDMYRFYRQSSELLAGICRDEGAKCIIHANYVGFSEKPSREATRRMRREIESIQQYAAGLFLWEDSIEGIFCHSNPYLMEEIVVPLNLPLNVDVSHTFIAFQGDNAKLEDVLRATKPYAAYYHLVDSMGLSHDSLPLGRGRIDWAMVKPYVLDCDFIFEIGLTGDHSDCTPMVESARYFERVEPIGSFQLR